MRPGFVKIRFVFDEPSLLDGCDILTKIGINIDPGVQGKYVGFSYANENEIEKLTFFASRFSFAELITNLDSAGVVTNESERIRITPKKTQMDLTK